MKYLIFIIMPLLCSCAFGYGDAKLQSDQMYEQQKTDRELRFYEAQLAAMEVARAISTTPLVEVKTPDIVLENGMVIKGTKFVVNREVEIQKFQQFDNSTPAERLTAKGFSTLGHIAMATVPFIGSWAQSVENRKTQEASYEYMTAFHQSQAAMITSLNPGTQPSPNVTETTNNMTITETNTSTTTDDDNYGDGSGNEIGGDQVVRQESPNDSSNHEANPTDNSTNESYNQANPITEAPIVQPVVPIVPVVFPPTETVQQAP